MGLPLRSIASITMRSILTRSVIMRSILTRSVIMRSTIVGKDIAIIIAKIMMTVAELTTMIDAKIPNSHEIAESHLLS